MSRSDKQNCKTPHAGIAKKSHSCCSEVITHYNNRPINGRLCKIDSLEEELSHADKS